MFLAREVVENPTNGPKLRYCERYSSQRNCEPQNIVSFVTDFQVVLKDVNGNEITPVCADKANVSNAAPSTPSCSTAGKENQDKVHTAEIFEPGTRAFDLMSGTIDATYQIPVSYTHLTLPTILLV